MSCSTHSKSHYLNISILIQQPVEVLTSTSIFGINSIQLLTIEALDIKYRPENTNIDRGEAKVNIGILWSISHHIQCLNSQQLFYYITLKKQRKKQANNSAALLTCISHYPYEPCHEKTYIYSFIFVLQVFFLKK